LALPALSFIIERHGMSRNAREIYENHHGKQKLDHDRF
jgi:hypothetical protein